MPREEAKHVSQRRPRQSGRQQLHVSSASDVRDLPRRPQQLEERTKHERVQQKYRKPEEKQASVAERGTVSPMNSLVTAKQVENVKLQPTEMFTQKSTNRRFHGFWKKFEKKKPKSNRPPVARRRFKTDYKWSKKLQHYVTPEYNVTKANSYFQDFDIQSTVARHFKKKRKNVPYRNISKNKREITKLINNKVKGERNLHSTTQLTTYLNDNKPKIKQYFVKNRNDSNKVKGNAPINSASTEKSLLSTLSKKVIHLKQLYGLEKHTTAALETLPSNSDTPSVTVNFEELKQFSGTAQIEALLDSIKVRAMQMIVEQNPAVTNIITNSVTETTFEADPVIKHYESNSPSYVLSTYISINNENLFDKRNIGDVVSSTESLMQTTENSKTPHNVAARSIKEDMYTIAQNVEAKLQKELNKVYKKVRCKVACDLKNEVDQVKSTLKQETEKTVHKISSLKTNVTKPMMTKKIKSKSKILKTKPSKSKTVKNNRRTAKSCRNSKSNTNPEPTTQSSFMDDASLISLYEQILAKSHSDNLMQMLSTEQVSLPKSKPAGRRARRNPKTVEDQAFKDSTKKFYDEEETMPDNFYEYSDQSGAPVMTSGTDDRTEDSADTSYEGLTRKLSYKDYVDGYKYYLNFQKEQGQQNFSNLIRYQAHKHHNVNDIGKYILNKIPQLLVRYQRNVFDETDTMEDQDVSTKSDESWFKQHFYLFLDNGPPRKFHTSQTVELRSPITETPTATTTAVDKLIPKPDIRNRAAGISREEYFTTMRESDGKEEFNLEELEENLHDHQLSPLPEGIALETTHDKIIKTGSGAHRFIDKLFGLKGRHILLERNAKTMFSDKNNIAEISKMTERHKRNIKVNNMIEPMKNNENLNTCKETKLGTVRHMNMMVQPTTIVKMREDKERKKSKFNKFFNNFKFHNHENKKDKKSKKIKRQYNPYRVRKFNPFSKLKDYFKMKPAPTQSLKPSMISSDYDMITSRIDSFKPIKYNKIQSLKEWNKQLPNISEDLPFLNPAVDVFKPTFDTAVNKPALPWQPDFMSFEELTSTTNEYLILPDLPIPTSKKNYALKPTPLQKKTCSRKEKFKSNDLMNVKMQSVSTTPHSTLYLHDIIESSATALDDNLNEEIDKIQITLAAQKKTIRPTTDFKLANVNSNSTKSITYNPIKEDSPRQLLVQTKLTRIEKFPIPRNKAETNRFENEPVIDRPQTDASLENIDTRINDGDMSSIAETSNGFLEELQDIPQVTISYRYDVSNANDKGMQSDIIGNKRWNENKYRVYPDYFNDLLLWHHDILNSDALSTTQWGSLLKEVRLETDYTTPDMNKLKIEANQITDFLTDLRKMNDTKAATIEKNSLPKLFFRPSKKKKNTRQNRLLDKQTFGSEVFKDDIAATSRDLIIKSEAQSFQLDNRRSSPDRYLKSADLIANLNRLQYSTNVDTVTENQIANVAMYSPSTCRHSRDKLGTPAATTKMNAAPYQSFFTPVPMTSNAFDRFLKNNRIDVQSVTAPLSTIDDLLKRNDNKVKGKSRLYDEFIRNDQSTFNAKQKTKGTVMSYIDVSSKSGRNDLTKVTPKLTSNAVTIDKGTTKKTPSLRPYKSDSLQNVMVADYDDSPGEDKRSKRYSNWLEPTTYNMPSNSWRREATKVNKYKPFMKNIFDYKSQSKETSGEKLQHITEVTPSKTNLDDIEFTILNIGDMFGVDTLASKFSKEISTPRVTKSLGPSVTHDYSIRDKFAFDRLSPVEKHNRLLFEPLGKAWPEAAATTETTPAADEPGAGPATETTSRGAPLHRLDHMEPAREPHRLRISGHSYKYDVIFDDGRGNNVYWRKWPGAGGTEVMYSPYSASIAEGGYDTVATVNAIAGTAAGDEGGGDKFNTPDGMPNEVLQVSDGALGQEYEPDEIMVSGHDLQDSKVTSKTSHSFKRTNPRLVKVKRDITSHGPVNTAKGVAALEIIVDFHQNTVNYGERDLSNLDTNQITTTSNKQSSCALLNRTSQMNTVQVHIDIPFGSSDNMKRSIETVKVRKVFSAKMSVPVDLEYQINSYAESASSVTTEAYKNTLPSMYLIVDNNKGGISLKPIDAETNVKIRKAADDSQKLVTVNPKEKVTLSEDFIAAVSKHLVQLYENLTLLNDVSTHNVKTRDALHEHLKDTMTRKRNISWDPIKKYLGHDRVCTCHFKANKTLCKPCLASDAVITKLTFELNGLTQYIKTHCTEIQTFFWMNPSGGKKLLDSVHKIEKMLNDYYKRIKGKCKGYKCNTFPGCVDKRDTVSKKELCKKLRRSLVNSLSLVADDLEKIKYNSCYDEYFGEEELHLMDAISNCFIKFPEKKSNNVIPSGKKIVKHVYSLDNINVNIICDPESAHPSTESLTLTVSPLVDAVDNLVTTKRSIFEYEMDEVTPTVRKSLKRLFCFKKRTKKKKSRLFRDNLQEKTKKATLAINTFINQESRVSQTEPLLISSFSKESTLKSRIARGINNNSIRNSTNEMYDNVTKKINLTSHSSPNTEINTIEINHSTVDHTNNYEICENSTIDTLSFNINQLLQLLGNLNDLNEIKNMIPQPDTPVTYFSTPNNTNKTWENISITTNKKPIDHSSFKTVANISSVNSNANRNKNTSVVKMANDITKAKINKAKTRVVANVTNDLRKLMNIIINNSTKSITESKSKQETVPIENKNISVAEQTCVEVASPIHTDLVKFDLYDKIKSATRTFLHSLKMSDNSTIKSKMINEIATKYTMQVRTPANNNTLNDPKPLKRNIYIESTTQNTINHCNMHNTTTNSYPTIVILSKFEEPAAARDFVERHITTKNINGSIDDEFDDFDAGRKLLLCILRFESEKLNEEWNNVEYHRSGDLRIRPDIIRYDSPRYKSMTTTKSKRALKVSQKLGTVAARALKMLNKHLTLSQSTAADEASTATLRNGAARDDDDGQLESRTKTTENIQKSDSLLEKFASKYHLKMTTITNTIKIFKRTRGGEITPPPRTTTTAGSDSGASMVKGCVVRTACDLDATGQCYLTPGELEEYIRHLLCRQDKARPKYLVIELLNNGTHPISLLKHKNYNKSNLNEDNRSQKRWNWIRDKRVLKVSDSNIFKYFDDVAENDKEEKYFSDVGHEDETAPGGLVGRDGDYFEKFYRGNDGVYRMIDNNRRKRSRRRSVTANFAPELKNLPPSRPVSQSKSGPRARRAP